MDINGKQIGEHVAGTHLEFLGRAPRRSDKDRASMGWYHCKLCGEIKAIRRADVRAGHTVSCNCVGNARFIEHHQKLASEIDASTRKAVFEAVYDTGRFRKVHRRLATGRMAGGSINAVKIYRRIIAKQFKLHPYTLDFLILAHKRYLLDVLKQGEQALSQLSEREFEMVPLLEWDETQKAQAQARRDLLDGMNWREREAFLEMERLEHELAVRKLQKKYPGKSLMEMLNMEPSDSVEIGGPRRLRRAVVPSPTAIQNEQT